MIEVSSRNRYPNMIQNEQVSAICCRMDVISGQNVKIIEGYVVTNFEVASFSSFLDFSKRSFCDGEVNAIWSRPGVDDDVISGVDVDTFQCCTCKKLWIIICSSF